MEGRFARDAINVNGGFLFLSHVLSFLLIFYLVPLLLFKALVMPLLILSTVMSCDPFVSVAFVFVLCPEEQVQRPLLKKIKMKARERRRLGKGLWSDYELNRNKDVKVISGGA